MKKITVEMVRSWEPFYNLAKVVDEDWEGTAWDILNLPISADDKLWIVLRDEVLPEATLREFARWCALQVAHMWNMSAAVREYLETGNDGLRAAAGVAARDAAAATGGAAAAAAWAATEAVRDDATAASAWAAAAAARDDDAAAADRRRLLVFHVPLPPVLFGEALVQCPLRWRGQPTTPPERVRAWFASQGAHRPLTGAPSNGSAGTYGDTSPLGVRRPVTATDIAQGIGRSCDEGMPAPGWLCVPCVSGRIRPRPARCWRAASSPPIARWSLHLSTRG